VATPYPRPLLLVVIDHGQGLWIVDDDPIMIQVVPHGVLVHHPLVDLTLQLAEIDLGPLEGVVDLLRHAEEVRGPLNQSPPRLDV